MARLRTELLTDDLYRRLGGAESMSRASEAIVICTVDVHGWPHPALLSYFEVAAPDRHNLRLAVYTNSRTCANMRERGKATLIIATPLLCYVAAPSPAVAEYAGSSLNAKLNWNLAWLSTTTAGPDPVVRVTSGITYAIRPHAGTLPVLLAELLE